MTRQTSIEVFKQIEAEGLLSRLRFEVYKLLFEQGPLTGSQVHSMLSKGKSDAGGTYTSRLSELRKAGVVEEVGEKACPLTGRLAILWDVTNKLPIKMEKPKRKKCTHCDGRGYFETQQSKLF